MEVGLGCGEVGGGHSFEAVGLSLEAHVVVLAQQDCARLASLQVPLHTKPNKPWSNLLIVQTWNTMFPVARVL